MKNNILLLIKATVLIFIVHAVLSCTETGKQSPEKNAQDEWSKNNTREISADDSGLARSKERTKESLPYFISEFKKRDGSFFVKEALSEDGQYEHMWLEVLKIDGEKSAGILNNDPVYFKKIKYLDTLTFDINSVEDIMIFKNDSLVFGGFLQEEMEQ